MIHLTQIFR